jgi:hypothetical protein
VQRGALPGCSLLRSRCRGAAVNLAVCEEGARGGAPCPASAFLPEGRSYERRRSQGMVRWAHEGHMHTTPWTLSAHSSPRQRLRRPLNASPPSTRVDPSFQPSWRWRRVRRRADLECWLWARVRRLYLLGPFKKNGTPPSSFQVRLPPCLSRSACLYLRLSACLTLLVAQFS